MRALVLAMLLAGCGGGADEVASAQMALMPSSGVSSIAAVEILVFDAASGGCQRVLMGTSPLDDPALVLVAHALFTIDGTPKELRIPAKKALDFYAEAFATTAPDRTRVGRGCVDETLAAGASTDVTISIDDDE